MQLLEKDFTISTKVYTVEGHDTEITFYKIIGKTRSGTPRLIMLESEYNTDEKSEGYGFFDQHKIYASDREKIGGMITARWSKKQECWLVQGNALRIYNENETYIDANVDH